MSIFHLCNEIPRLHNASRFVAHGGYQIGGLSFSVVLNRMKPIDCRWQMDIYTYFCPSVRVTL